MIYTITFNPAIDYTIKVDNFTVGNTNRCYEEYLQSGGKGINCAIILTRLGIKTITSGFLATNNNELILQKLKEENIVANFILIEGMVRINVKIKSDQETEVNARGPLVIASDWEAFIKQASDYHSDDFVVISGNLANGMDQSQLKQFLKILNEKQVNFSLDINSDSLKHCLSYQPLLIKPNLAELQQLCNKKLVTDSQIITAAKLLQQQGVHNVLVSLGKNGSIYITSDNEVYRVSAAEGLLINSVGAGDSMLAGFIASYFVNKKSIEVSLKMAAACGAATSFTKWLATAQDIEKLISLIKVERLEE